MVSAAGEKQRLDAFFARFPDDILVRGQFFHGLRDVISAWDGPAVADALAAAAGVNPAQLQPLGFARHRDFYRYLILAASNLRARIPLAAAMRELAQTFYPVFRQSEIGRNISGMIASDPIKLMRFLPQAYEHSVVGNRHRADAIAVDRFRWEATVEPAYMYPQVFTGILEGALAAEARLKAHVSVLEIEEGAERNRYVFDVGWFKYNGRKR